jgi:hypothetical protein
MDGSLSQKVFENNQEKEQQTLEYIKQLQNQEKDLYSKLQTMSANNKDLAEQEATVKKINELSQIRIGLFKILNNHYGSVQESVANSRVNLVDQLTAVGVIEKELNNAKEQLNQLENVKNNKMRMVEINTYYGKRYKAHIALIKQVIVIFVLLLLLGIIMRIGIISAFIPDNVFYGLATIIILVGGYGVIKSIIDLVTRDNMNYDEYNWYFDPRNAKPTVYEYDVAQLKGVSPYVQGAEDELTTMAKSMNFGCIGQNCCSPGMTFDEVTKKCVIAQNGNATTNTNIITNKDKKESFTSGQLNKSCFLSAYAKDSVTLKNTNEIMPYSEEGLNYSVVKF